MKTIQMTIDEPLLKAVDKAIRAKKISRSAFIRKAMVLALRHQAIEELEARHAEGYRKQPVKPGEFDAFADEQAWEPA
ncbi:MAG: ribbon-helix-helix domain-containing protein [Lysobacteraceae bacterium]|jgi:metal-responsive CopG/Arc/MetJ family transcriptional regulator